MQKNKLHQTRQAMCQAFAATVLTGLFSFTAFAGPFDLPEEGDHNNSTIFSGLLDVRYVHTSQMKTIGSGGSNVLRYGGRGANTSSGAGGHDADVFAVPQASLVLDAPMPMDTSVFAQLNLTSESDNGHSSVGIEEVYGRLDRRWGSEAARVRVGAMLPPISWEHPNTAWSTEYTITPSAIGSWLEDTKVVGGECTWEHSSERQRFRLTGAGFSGADQTGVALLNRGWVMDDSQSNLDSTYNLPNGKTVAPIRELDGRVGYYGRAGFSLFNDLFQGAAGYWDNNGDVNANINDPSIALHVWRTRFWDVGGKTEWHGFTFISTFVRGQSASATTTDTFWETWYALGSYRISNFIFSGRYDRFMIKSGLEDGHAYTGDIQYVLNARNRVALEFIEAITDPNFLTHRHEKDQIAQLNYRFYFGGK